MHLRPAIPADAEQIAAIYYHTIHTVNAAHYTAPQCEAWAPAATLDPTGWRLKQRDRYTLVAEREGQLLGFGELLPSGHVDCFYVHHAHQRQGVGRAILAGLEAEAARLGLQRLDLEASLTAQPFFEACGWRTLARQQVERRGQLLTNFRMEKELPGRPE
ncbi:MAG: GNAT family N-acetyltransferase [Planctomycetaceae bacterium]